MTFLGVIAVGLGAFVGACMRWGAGLFFASIQWNFPFSTLLVNLVGSFLIGLSVSFFSEYPHISQEIKLLIVTGFLGGLTTFSTFSLEAMELLQKAEWQMALLHSASHLIGSILLCFAGFYTWRLF